jgi:hypothetical protein
MEQIWTDAVAAFESQLGLETGFVYRLAKEDDWSFVVKAHALLEAMLSHSLPLAAIDGLTRTLRGLNNARKIQAARDLSIIDDDDERALRELSRLRNKLAHDVSMTRFHFADHLQDGDERLRFQRAFSGIWASSIDIDGATVGREQFASANPKVTIWMWCQRILVAGELFRRSRDLDHRVAALDKVGADILRDMFGDPRPS